MSATIVSFHAHPDDEALLTAGTLARLAAEGHRVVLVIATAGEAGLAAQQLGQGDTLGSVRLNELQRSADILGCARVVVLGYADSGMAGKPTGAANAFAATPVEEAAERLALVLREERADILTSYDPAGGYGHPDHLQVHRVGRRAAELAGTRVLLEATVDRTALQRVLRLVRWVKRGVPDLAAERFEHAFTERALLTHEVDVRQYWRQKRAAMQAHASQASADNGDRTLAWFLRLPGPVFRRVFGREWFVEPGRAAARPLIDDVLRSLGS
jgi:LmbE family N-acetylglucosaminyl deacetylase